MTPEMETAAREMDAATQETETARKEAETTGTFIDGTLPFSFEGDEGSEEIDVSFSSELMTHYSTGRVIDGRERSHLAMIRDADGYPILFSRSTDAALMAIVRREEHPTGWEQFDLTHGLGEGEAVAFGVGQREDGRFTLAVAFRPQGEGRTSVHLTRPLPDDVDGVDWTGFAREWRHRGESVENAAVQRVMVGSGDADGDGGPLVIVAVRDRGELEHFRVSSELAAPARPWTRCRLAENASQLVDLALGQHLDGPGFYTCFRREGELRLFFTTVPDEAGRVYHVKLPVPAKTTSLAVLPGTEEGHTDLYLAGEGIHLIPADDQVLGAEGPDPIQVAPPEAARGIRTLLACEDDAGVALWALDGEGTLLSVAARKAGVRGGRGAAWQPPIALARGVSAVAPIRNPEKRANDLVTVEGDQCVVHRTQSAGTGLWSEKPIPLSDTGRVQALTGYATQLHAVHRATGAPVSGRKLRVTASDWCEVTVNGASHMIDRDTPLEAFADAQGDLTLIHPVKTLATPVFHVSMVGAAQAAQPVDPTGKVFDRLRKMRSGDDLRGARDGNGKPVVDPDVPAETLGAVASAIARTGELADQLPTDGSPARGPLGPLGAAGVRAWGVRMHADGRVEYVENAEALAVRSAALAAVDPWRLHPSADGALLPLERIAGDVLHWFRQLLERAFAFVAELAEGVWNVVVTIGREAFRFVVSALGHVYSAVNELLKRTLGLDLDRLRDWLGFLFSWNDILTTHRVMANVAARSVDMGRLVLDDAVARAGALFDGLIAQARSLAPSEREDARTPVDRGAYQRRRGLRDDARGGLDSVERHPGGSFASYQLLHGGGVLAGGGAPAGLAAAELDWIGEFLEKQVRPLLETVENGTAAIGREIAALVANGEFSVNQAVLRLTRETAIALLQTLKQVVLLVLEVARKIADAVDAVVNTPLDVPFLSAFYAAITGRSEGMTLLEGLTLLLAVPATVAYKAVKQAAPFAGGTGGLDTMGARELLEAFQGYREPRGAAAAPGRGGPEEERNRVLLSYADVGGLASARLLACGAVAEGGLVMAGTTMPIWGSAPLVITRIGLTVPTGPWTMRTTRRWVFLWVTLLKAFGDAKLANPKLAGAMQALLTLGKAPLDVVAFVEGLRQGGDPFPVVCRGFEDLAGLAGGLAFGAAKIAEGVPRAALAATGTAALLADAAARTTNACYAISRR